MQGPYLRGSRHAGTREWLVGSKSTVDSSTGKKKKPERRSRFSTPVDDEALEFIQAIETYKHEKGRPFPSWTEVLQILKSLGYRKS